MDCPCGQQPAASGRSDATPTRQRLLRAAAELIADHGWGQVTTRAIAQRAGLPHGTVSYHFHGKHQLLTEAALAAIERLAPTSQLHAAHTLPDLLGLITTWAGGHAALDPVGTRVLLEAMRQAERDPALRQRLASMLADYRQLLTAMIGAEQRHGATRPGPPPAAVATLITAVGDGLLLHTLLDPDLDPTAAIQALGTLLGHQPGT